MDIEKKLIDGMEFELAALPAWKAYEVLARITKFVSPAIEALGVARGGDKEAALGAVAKAFASVQGTELQALTKVLLEPCLVTFEGNQVQLMRVFDAVMRKKMLTVFRLLAWSVEVNYPDFFEALKSTALAGKLKGLDLTSQSEQPPAGPVSA